MTHVIGVGGKKCHGKDTWAEGLGEDWVKIGMSDKLCEALVRANPMIKTDGTRVVEYLEQLNWDWTKAKEDEEVRESLQRFGTEMGRGLFGENVWVDLTWKRVRELQEQGKNVVITGIRFPNELAAVKEAGGTSVYIVRPSLVGEKDGTSNHASENSLTPEDFDTVFEIEDATKLQAAAREFGKTITQ